MAEDQECMKVQDGYLEIRIKLADHGLSASGKSRVLASTRGNVDVGEYKGKRVILGLNCYIKA